ncbi:intradiol ring-cleavage dioxygenase [Streptomyces sp. NPDC091268]|uniref:dioxygenase family protein n=1 Tax=Streptomyces sp. NPDC091268 TaxID=3365979 RepID=UPI0037F8F865
MTADRPPDARRRTLVLAAASTALAALAPACAGREVAAGAGGRAPAEPAAGTGGPSGPPPACVLTPESSQGPYYAPGSPVRSAVVEDREGVPLRLDLRIVRSSRGCAPLVGAAVEIWQADAVGTYSAHGATYLRGTQTTDRNGLVTFRTLVPGWYAHLAPHVHFKVRPDRHTEVSSQLFLPEDLLRTVYAGAPYSRREAPAHPNARDDRFAAKGPLMTLQPVKDGAGYRAAFVVGIA